MILFGGFHMDESVLPIVNEWYQDPQGDYLMVIAVEEDDGIVEVQFFEGEIAEFDLETWNAMGFETSEAPEDWTDDIDRDDLGDTDYPLHPEDWNGPADEMEKLD